MQAVPTAQAEPAVLQLGVTAAPAWQPLLRDVPCAPWKLFHVLQLSACVALAMALWKVFLSWGTSVLLSSNIFSLASTL